ncbi:hypothetical protein [Lysobacter firmicutimachus]|uniref:DUF2570 domain-containing protein n=1 Tax=Lysobacter firmicutimachus TaxID=1792846 RepID=A0ABU8CYL1_9GAMM
MIAALAAVATGAGRWAVILALGLLASLSLNLWQWERARTAQLRIENRALGAALTTVQALATDATRDNKALLAELDALIERGRTTRAVYRHAATQAPLHAQCAPGAERIQAVNQGLGPSESSPERVK